MQESSPFASAPARVSTGIWLFSWPLLAAAFAYAYAISRGDKLLMDGDTLWHVTAGNWMLAHRQVPHVDPFSHTMAGAPWTAHEWLSEILLAGAHDWGGWTLVVALTAAALAVTVALLVRALLEHLEPIYALLFAGFAVAITSGHLLARPHILALPLMMAWTIELVRAREAQRMPRWWMLPLMSVWANLHGGFTLGFVLAAAAAAEHLLACPRERRVQVAMSWALFLALALAFSLATPNGVQGILFTWHVVFESTFALERIGEWRSPDFQSLTVLEVWILGGMALVLYQGLRLPPVRLAVVLGLLHMALKHARYGELVGLLAPLYVAAPFAAQWRQRAGSRPQAEALDRLFMRLAGPAGPAAVASAIVLLGAASTVPWAGRPPQPMARVMPEAALAAARHAGVTGPVLNSYGTGGALIYLHVPVFIDGRSDMYGDDFLKEYVHAMELSTPDSLPKLLDRYAIGWTLIEPKEPATVLLDHLPGWRRIYADDVAVVHVRTQPDTVAEVPPATHAPTR